MTTYDMEYLFCQIRSKSVGETVELMIACEDKNCNHSSTVKANISEANVNMPDKIETLIKLNDSISVEMKHLSYYDFLSHNDMKQDTPEPQLIFNSVLRSIVAIHTENERINVNDEPIKDLELFVDSLNSAQYTKLKKFIAESPRVSLDVKWNCEKCNRGQSLMLEGLEDFFQ